MNWLASVNLMWLLALAGCVALSGCGHRLNHPPTFADFRRALDLNAERTGAVDQQVAVFERGLLTRRESSRILAGVNVTNLIGAALQSPVHDPLGLTLAVRATVLHPTHPLPWAALSYQAITLLKNQMGPWEANLGLFTNAIHRWKSLEPLNAMPVYLEARYWLFVTNASRAAELVATAGQMARFDTYEEPLRACVAEAYRSRAYPEYTALVLALGHSAGSLHLAMLGKDLLKELPSTTKTLLEVAALGKRIATGKTLLAELLGISLQLNVMDKVPSERSETERSVLTGRRDQLRRASK